MTYTPTHLGEVEAVAADIGILGQARLLVQPAKGVAQHVVDLLERPRAALLGLDPVVSRDQRDEGAVGGVAVAAGVRLGWMMECV